MMDTGMQNFHRPFSKEETIATEIKGPEAAMNHESGATDLAAMNLNLRDRGALPGTGSYDGQRQRIGPNK